MNNDTNNNNFTWNTIASTSDNILFSGTVTATTTNSNWCSIKTPDKDWMPYCYVEYEPIWHKKFARIKLQMDHMWD